jgi:hypothetical protein
MIDRPRRIAICHLLLRGTRWMSVSVTESSAPMTAVLRAGRSSAHFSVRSLKEMQSLHGRRTPDSWLEKSERMALWLR